LHLPFLSPNSKFFPINTYFDHLYSEYEALDPPLPDGSDKDPLKRINGRRHDRNLPKESKFAWDDIYAFELTLVKHLPLSDLRNKAITLRERYLNVFGQDKFKTYLETHLPDPANASADELREEIKYLLAQLALAFAALHARDGLGKSLTKSTAFFLLIALIIGTVFLLSSFHKIPWLHLNPPSTPIMVVFFAGMMGGLISVLQRLQAIPTAGDPLFSLATFWHGSYALWVSPLTGAIFGVLLYLVFASGVLQGRFFPEVFTPETEQSGTTTGAPAASGMLKPPLSPSSSSSTMSSTNSSHSGEPQLVKATASISFDKFFKSSARARS
jgi:uncharacterized membrane protein SirB2